MRILLCNEVIRERPFAAQCDYAAALGYDGLELAPFTLGAQPHRLSGRHVGALRRALADSGITVDSLHWLLLAPPGLSITSADVGVRARTLEVMRGLVELAAALGAKVLVHGSPAQRRLPADDPAGGRARARDAFRAAAEAAAAAGVTYCVEALAANETDYLNTIAEAAALVDAVDSPALRTMVDCSAAAQAEAEPVAAVLDRWLPTGKIAHIQVNDRNRRGPGQGEDRFAPVFAALRRHGYAGAVAVEPFDYQPDGAAAAARAIGYVRGILEAQER